MIKNIYFYYYFFFTGMFISKTIQPIYWEQVGVINFFSYSYSIMTFAGVFTLSYIFIIKKIGLHKTLLIGIILYSFGLFLRAFPINIKISLISGFISGIGASINLLSIKFWILNYGDEEKKK